MANNNKLKAFVRYDGNGVVIPSSVILNRFKPAVGNWKEIDANQCCNPTTTTTTTAAPTTTTTTTSSCNCREVITREALYNYYDCQGVNWICVDPETCRDPSTNCIDISLPYTGVTFGGVTESCNCNS